LFGEYTVVDGTTDIVNVGVSVPVPQQFAAKTTATTNNKMGVVFRWIIPEIFTAFDDIKTAHPRFSA